MTPAKKATSKSLSDLLGSDSTPSDTEVENPENVSPEVETPENENTGIDGTDVEQPGSEVVETEKPVEQGNPDGVSFSGSGNVIDKTPAELSAESPEETAQRFNISDEIPENVANNPNIQVYADDQNYQIPGGTHVHPDVAKDNYNRSVGSPNNSVQTTRTVTENVYATEAENDDKGRKDVFDRDEDYVD